MAVKDRQRPKEGHGRATEIKGESVKVRPEAIRVVNSSDRMFRNPRLTFKPEAMEELQQSIATIGLLQPLLIKRVPGTDEFELIGGERRLRCIRNLIKLNAAVYDTEHEEMDKASVVYEFVDVRIVNPKNDLEQLKFAVADNMEHSQVPDWDILTLALDLESRVDPNGNREFSREDICEVFNRSAAWMSHTMSLANLPSEAQKRLKDGTLSRTAAVHLLAAKREAIPQVLVRSEEIIKEDSLDTISDAAREVEWATLEFEAAVAALKEAQETGDILAAKLAQRKATASRQKVSSAQHRQTQGEKRLHQKELTAEAVDRALEEIGARQEGVKAKARSTKLLRMQVGEMRQSLDQSESDFVVEPGTDNRHSKKDVALLLSACDWVLGKKGGTLWTILNEEVKLRTQEQEGRSVATVA